MLRHPDRCTSDCGGAGCVAPTPCVAGKRVHSTLWRLAQKKVRTSTPHVTKTNQLLLAPGSALPNESTPCNIIPEGSVATLEPGPRHVSGTYPVRVQPEHRPQP